MSRANGALSDTALDREIDGALHVDHSADFVARVRERVARESASATASWVPAPAAAAAGAAILAGVLWLVDASPRHRAAEDKAHTLSVARIRSVPAGAPTLRSSAIPQLLQRPRKTPARANESAEVLISPDDATAIDRLLAFSRAHVVVLQSVTAENRSGALEALVIPPIVIEPLPRGGDEGGRP